MYDEVFCVTRFSSSQALAPLGIGVATGESCQNRVMFKQFLSAGAMQFCQIDACRLGGPNEILPIILMAAKYKGTTASTANAPNTRSSSVCLGFARCAKSCFLFDAGKDNRPGEQSRSAFGVGSAVPHRVMT